MDSNDTGILLVFTNNVINNLCLIFAELYTMEKGAYSGKGQWHRLLDVGWGGMGCVASLLSPPSFRRHTWTHPGTMGFGGGGGELGFIARCCPKQKDKGRGKVLLYDCLFVWPAEPWMLLFSHEEKKFLFCLFVCAREMSAIKCSREALIFRLLSKGFFLGFSKELFCKFLLEKCFARTSSL